MTWGIEKNVIERFEAAGVPRDRISFARDTYTFNFPVTVPSSSMLSDGTVARQ
jgi:hypothetical protein